MNLSSLRSRAVRAACGVCLMWGSAALAGGPSSDDPEAVLPCGALPGNLEEYSAAVEAYQHAVDLILAVLKEHETSGFKKAMLLAIGKARTAAIQAERRISRLTLVGEPASFELDVRIRELHKRLDEVYHKTYQDPTVRTLVDGTHQRWLNEASKLQKAIPKAEQLAERKEWDEAAQALFDPIDKLTPQGMWYNQLVQTTGFAPFLQPLGKIESELFATIRSRAIGERNEAIARELPDFVAIQRDVDTAIQGVTAGGKGNFDGQEQTGPGLLGAIGARWRHANLAAWRARAHYWALQQQTGNSPNELSVLEQAYERFTGTMVQACSRLIEADAARAAASDVAGLHREYVETLAPLLEFDY
jgi:hypothetical protein